ncbi:MAG: hypothetical protein AUK47_15030 [Deltaproteobacteria bacterium CG2_30_63_29]|nr:MAG: hypothetical protein AUK47_15030 [Deltaproteobacteria bacterium CG2_30_63_29]PJB37867.1 MAG: restriction endonuclease [Deltaproteobacteria bacterium CG_4_9_14_3_um_filter_63_12]
MTPHDLLQAFDILADAPEGVARLRELVLQLAVQGKLVPQDSEDEPAGVLLERIGAEKVRAEGAKQKQFALVTEGEVPFEVPKGWAIPRLAGIAELINGDRGKNYPSKQHQVEQGIPFINAGHLKGGIVDTSEMNFITPERFELLRSGKVQEDDILYCLRGSLGKCGIVGGIDFGAIASSLLIVRLFPGCLPRFAYLVLVSPFGLELVKRHDNGSAQPNLSATNVGTYPIPYPPLAEQHRIVQKVDALMGLLDRLESARAARESTRAALRDAALAALRDAESAEEVEEAWGRLAENLDALFTEPGDVEPLRQAVLQLAVRGRLVRQEAGDEPASVLLGRIGEEKARLVREGKIRAGRELAPVSEGEVPFEVPSGWVWTRLGEVTSLITSGSRGWNMYYADSGATFIRSQDIKHDRLDFDQRAFVQIPDGAEGTRTSVESGDLVLTITGANVGKCALLSTAFGDTYVSQHVGLIRLLERALGRFMHRIRELREALVNNSDEFSSDAWFQNLRSLAGECVSLIDVTLHQLYFKAQHDPLPGWAFDDTKLGERHNRRIADKLKWGFLISGNPLNAKEEIAAFDSIRELRNHLQHFDPPCFCFTLERDAVKWLNDALLVGRLAWKIRQQVGAPLSMPLIRLLLAPEAAFQPGASASP